ncbi:phycobiliprotein lyase [Prochlorococcus marinus]|uniref:phycobiliprotein lyase n=1 Tax=Prochlorococcus marinus TaxID=1219 RepID=UPI0022B39ABE|nr:phycobiliprotein lyase [Prochlorococcus marinus]
MEIEEFINKSEGEWNSMRSGHSLAFKQFEEIVSHIKITKLKQDDSQVQYYLNKSQYSQRTPTCPFKIEWEGISDWSDKDDFKGSSLLIPIQNKSNSGMILKSLGYAEKIESISNYHFLSDCTLILSTEYEETVAEERIWFINSNLRCRSSVIKSLKNKSILQTSFASELRKIF